jgi:hypothetical protein
MPKSAQETFLRRAIRENQEWNQARAAEGASTRSIFQFVRLVKFHPQVKDLSATEAADRVEAGLAKEFSVADGWSVFPKEFQASWEAFVSLWDEIRTPVGFEDPLVEAVRRVDEGLPLEFPFPDSPGRATYRRFLSIACHLQQIVPQGKPIALPVERLAELLEVTHQQVSSLRKAAVSEGWLIQVLASVPPRDGRSGQAATFRFLTERLKKDSAVMARSKTALGPGRQKTKNLH